MLASDNCRKMEYVFTSLKNWGVETLVGSYHFQGMVPAFRRNKVQVGPLASSVIFCCLTYSVFHHFLFFLNLGVLCF